MSAPLPDALRARFQRLIEKEFSGRAAALRLQLSPATGARGGGLQSAGLAKREPRLKVGPKVRGNSTHIAAFSPKSSSRMATSRCLSWPLPCTTRPVCRRIQTRLASFSASSVIRIKKVAGGRRAPPEQGKEATRELVQAPHSGGIGPTRARCLH